MPKRCLSHLGAGSMGGMVDAFCSEDRAVLWAQRRAAAAEGVGVPGQRADVADSQDNQHSQGSPPQSGPRATDGF
eukprot:CAMPEP_0184289938 /NCGR_PEP_ID=MMETSP1049-20130417/2302_1 /TAXON_ID=77928 /ORGANISM="Proteomonas sulcata, Strain CCMP704" /LENGTH=74 /DNA_ID=CAMNT_0026596933 /DNA_START=226 /DNA_END=450 /DNA_ORIENTATION=+